MKKQISFRHIAVALALGLGVAASSLAAPPCHGFMRGGVDGPGYGMKAGYGMGAGHGMGFGIHSFQGMNRLHEELKLDERQEALWKEAEQSSIDHRKAMAERMHKHYSETKAMFDQPGADMRSILKRGDELRSEGFKERDAIQDRWLSVYDSLDPDQKETVRLFFKDRMERRTEPVGQEGQGYGRRGNGRGYGRRG